MRRVVLVLAVLAGTALPSPGLVAQQGGAASSLEEESNTPVFPGDEIQLRIWREPDMSGNYLVGPNGMITVPLLGTVKVTDRPISEVKDELIQGYSQYLRTPSIEVYPLRRVEIGGAVNNPSLYRVDPTVTVFGALALAGGPRPNGKPDEVQLRRAGEILTTFVDGGALLANSPIRSGDQLFVPERSWFERNSNVLTAGISASVSIFIALMIRN